MLISVDICCPISNVTASQILLELIQAVGCEPTIDGVEKIMLECERRGWYVTSEFIWKVATKKTE